MKEPIKLTASDRKELQAVLHRGKANARTLTRARILLKAADGWSNQRIMEAIETSLSTVKRVRERYAEGGLARVLQDQPQAHRRHALTPVQSAHLVAITCSPVPDGHDHWTVRLLADQAVELGFVESISPETIRQLLKKTNSNRGNTSTGAFHR
ncbi:helix-turn-helix domain-containing protein [Ktedonobacter racemifer]|uniref:Transposase n=1 Tax=Ktedonobacter racemifer DSM 44963 TaxID=485913 RepID=D6U400_KTERA|nr:helix-turn-helix domain-containing protein [Ktedonobacter racemifer]EFH81238.1 transposase [Ktedonobacter racemifer DSM 44963]